MGKDKLSEINRVYRIQGYIFYYLFLSNNDCYMKHSYCKIKYFCGYQFLLFYVTFFPCFTEETQATILVSKYSMA